MRPPHSLPYFLLTVENNLIYCRRHGLLAIPHPRATCRKVACLTLRCNLVLVERMPLVAEDCAERLQVGGGRIEPSIDVLGLDIDDRTIVACGRNLGLEHV